MAIISLMEKTKLLEPDLYKKEPEWVLYVHDHRKDILDRSTTYSINHVTQYAYNYNLYHLLKDQQYPPDIIWIVQMINNLKSECDFVNKEFIILPDKKHLNELYITYKSYRAQYNKLKKK